MNGCDFYCTPVANNLSNQQVTPYLPTIHTTKNKTYVIAKADSGASHNYWRDEDKVILKNITLVNGPTVTLPNNLTLKSVEEGVIPLSPLLSNQATKASIIPGLTSSSLISLGQIADDGCTILLNKKKLFAIKDKDIVMQGTRNLDDGLWDIPVYK